MQQELCSVSIGHGAVDWVLNLHRIEARYLLLCFVIALEPVAQFCSAYYSQVLGRGISIVSAFDETAEEPEAVEG